eukprot:gene17355-23658_t
MAVACTPLQTMTCTPCGVGPTPGRRTCTPAGVGRPAGIEFFLWTYLNDKMKNRVISMVGLFAIMLQPIVSVLRIPATREQALFGFSLKTYKYCFLAMYAIVQGA